MKEYTIDAEGRSLGRVATEASRILSGKNDPGYKANVVAPVSVHVIHAEKIRFSPKKKSQKVYTTYTGYPGGLREENLAHLIDRRGYEEVVKRAVLRMLPNNKLRSRTMQNLKITP